MLGELSTDSAGDRLGVEVGCRRQLLTLTGRARGLPERAEDGEPELLGVLLVAPHLDDCQPVRLAWPVRPGPQQRALAAAGGGRDKRYLGFRRAIKGREKLPALNQLRSRRIRPSVIRSQCHA
jgi:hypothetical protein